jgi:hypothetical protein
MITFFHIATMQVTTYSSVLPDCISQVNAKSFGNSISYGGTCTGIRGCSFVRGYGMTRVSNAFSFLGFTVWLKKVLA